MELTRYDRVKIRSAIVALRANGGNKRMAAERLGVTRKTFYNWMERYPAIREYHTNPQALTRRRNKELADEFLPKWLRS